MTTWAMSRETVQTLSFTPQGPVFRCILKRMRAQAMAAQGSGGAYEISQRMTAAVGWGATAAFKEDWVWDQAAATYALDPDMAATLQKNNPQVRLLADSTSPTLGLG